MFLRGVIDYLFDYKLIVIILIHFKLVLYE